MKIYISGKISGLPEGEAAPKFKRAEIQLQQKGHVAINPFEIGLPYETQWQTEGLSDRERWERHMDRDLDLLRDCDAIFMLDNWAESRGAIIEIKEAISHGLPVYGHAPEEQITKILTE